MPDWSVTHKSVALPNSGSDKVICRFRQCFLYEVSEDDLSWATYLLLYKSVLLSVPLCDLEIFKSKIVQKNLWSIIEANEFFNYMERIDIERLCWLGADVRRKEDHPARRGFNAGITERF